MTYAVGRPLWIDDTHSTHHAFDGLGGVIDSLRTDSHPPLYFFLLAFWMGLGGLGEVWLRLPSIAFSLAGAAVLFIYARRAGDPRLPWVCTVLFLFNPTVVRHFHTIRPYPLAGLLAAISTVMFLRAAGSDDRPSRRHWIGYAAVNALGTLTHYWFFFLLAGQAVGATLFARGRARLAVLLGIAASVVPFAIFWSPVLLEQMQGGPTSWMGAPGGFWLVRSPLELLGGWDQYDFSRFAMAFYALFGVACLVRLAPPGLVSLQALRSVLVDRGVVLAATIPAVVMITAFTVSQITPVYAAKYAIVALPAWALALGTVLTRLGDRILVPVFCGLFLAGSMALRDDFLAVEFANDNRAVTEQLIREVADGDELVHVTINYAPTKHYLRALAPDQTFSQTVFPAEVAEHVGWVDRPRALADRDGLHREAAELAGDLARRVPPGRVWVLADLKRDSAFTNLLLGELDKELDLERTLDLTGWWVSEVRVYAAKPTSSEPGESLER